MNNIVDLIIHVYVYVQISWVLFLHKYEDLFCMIAKTAFIGGTVFGFIYFLSYTSTLTN